MFLITVFVKSLRTAWSLLSHLKCWLVNKTLCNCDAHSSNEVAAVSDVANFFKLVAPPAVQSAQLHRFNGAALGVLLGNKGKPVENKSTVKDQNTHYNSTQCSF